MPKPYHTPKSERDEALGQLADAEQASEAAVLDEIEEAEKHTAWDPSSQEE
jgi:hypothetical protein